MEKRNRKSREYTVLLLLAFFLPVAIMLVGFIIMRIFPFGDRCFLSTDLYHQYLPFFSEFMRAI